MISSSSSSSSKKRGIDNQQTYTSGSYTVPASRKGLPYTRFWEILNSKIPYPSEWFITMYCVSQ